MAGAYGEGVPVKKVCVVLHKMIWYNSNG